MTTFVTWAGWAVLLLAQNAAFTWVSRARNSGSTRYHAVAAVFSNGVWFAGQFIIFDQFTQARESGDMRYVAFLFAFYTLFTVLGSVGAHHVLQTRVETGARRIGARQVGS